MVSRKAKQPEIGECERDAQQMACLASASSWKREPQCPAKHKKLITVVPAKIATILVQSIAVGRRRSASSASSYSHNAREDKDGNLEIKDDKTGETLPLEFVEIYQPVRHLKKEGEYFACTDFRKPGSQDEYYDIDFWVNQKTGKLQVDNVKVHKVPVQEDGVWTQVPRYTFDGMDIEETN